MNKLKNKLIRSQRHFTIIKYSIDLKILCVTVELRVPISEGTFLSFLKLVRTGFARSVPHCKI